MAKILGLDLGTNSIGWAFVDDSKKEILGIGSRVFPAGVNELGQGEKELSKNAVIYQQNPMEAVGLGEEEVPLPFTPGALTPEQAGGVMPEQAGGVMPDQEEMMPPQ